MNWKFDTWGVIAIFALLVLCFGIQAVSAEERYVYSGQVGSEAAEDLFSGPEGVAVDSVGNVYVVDRGHNQIQKFTSTGIPLQSWGHFGSGVGEFNSPSGIAIDHADNVYVYDSGNNRVQKFTSNGEQILDWSMGTAESYGQIAVDSHGNVYVIIGMGFSINKYDSTGHLITTLGSYGSGEDQFIEARSIGIDGADNVYVGDNAVHRVKKFDASGNPLTSWEFPAAPGQDVFHLTGIQADSAGDIFVVEQVRSRILKFTSTGGYVTEYGTHGSRAGEFNSPSCIAFDHDGNFYVTESQWGNNRVQKFSSSGTFVTQWGNKIDGEYRSPYGVTLDSTGNVYVADLVFDRVQKFSSSGSFITTWGSPGYYNDELSGPEGIAVDSAGNVYVVDSNNFRVKKFTSDGTYVISWGGYGTGNLEFVMPRGIAVDSAGNVYVVDNEGNCIKKFDSNGGHISTWGSYGSGDGQFKFPRDIAIDSTGNVYITDEENHCVQKWTTSGTFISKFGSAGLGDGQFSDPRGIAVDGSGNIYVTDNAGTDGANHRVQKFSSNGIFVTKWGTKGSGDGQFLWPESIAVDSAGTVYVADYGNGRVQKFKKEVELLPSAAFSGYPQSGNAPLTVNFLDYSTYASSWSWDFGDGTRSTEQQPSHVYTTPGRYPVSLTVSNQAGRTSTETKYDFVVVTGTVQPTTVLTTAAPTVQPTPTSSVIAGFTANATSGSIPMTVQFTDASTGNPFWWWWHFGDGSYSNEQNPVHEYTREGEYSVALYVWSQTGSANTVKTSYITVSGPLTPTPTPTPVPGAPDANFTMSRTSGTAPLYVRFVDTSTNATSWRWDFGPTAWTSSRNPSVVFRQPGEYSITLTAKNEFGSSQMTKNLTVTGVMPRSVRGSAISVVG